MIHEAYYRNRRNTTRYGMGAIVIVSLTRRPNVTLAEPQEIRPQNLSLR